MSLAEIAKAKRPERAKPIDGRSFAGLLADPTSAWPEREVFASNPDDKGLAVVTARYKYLEGKSESGLYDLIADPHESRNMNTSERAVAGRMREDSKTFHNNVLKEGRAFARPVFLVGHKGAASTMFWAYGASQVTGGLKIGNHTLGPFARAKDKALFDLIVETAGAYVFRVREKIPPGTLFVSAAGSTAPVYGGMPADLSAAKGLVLPSGKVRLALGMKEDAGEKFGLTRIFLERIKQ